jgi:threonine/homoserine/homoserine lactone efflux protein
MGLLIRGLILGFSIAAPVGPIGVLCIRRTLAHGRLSGFVSGLGAASADAIYGSIAAFGLTIITNFLVSKQDVLGLIGGIFLCYLGIRTFFDSPEPIKENGIDVNQKLNGAYSLKSLLSDYGSTFILTLTNPLTILAFAAIFAGLGLTTTSNSIMGGIPLILGVFAGSTMWWLILSSSAHLFRTHFLTKSALRWVNRISGVIIAGFGLVAIWI